LETKGSLESIIDILAQNEEDIGILYRAYSEKFPDHVDFWKELAQEEAEHASWIRKLAAKAQAGTIIVKENRFNTVAIRTFSKYLEQEHARLKMSPVSLVNALSVAMYIEDSIIEHNYFEVFEGDDFEFKKTLLDLASATNEHRIRIKDALKSVSG